MRDWEGFLKRFEKNTPISPAVKAELERTLAKHDIKYPWAYARSVVQRIEKEEYLKMQSSFGQMVVDQHEQIKMSDPKYRALKNGGHYGKEDSISTIGSIVESFIGRQ